MLYPKDLLNKSLEAMKNNSKGEVENRINQAAISARTSITFQWDAEPELAEYVEKFKDDKFLFPEGLEIKTDAQGITVSWANA